MKMELKHKSYIDTAINQLSESEARWFAVYTKFKCEKYVSAQLAKKNIEAYVPIITHIKKYQRKKKVVEIPLIHCYVFVKIKKEDYLRTLETDHVMKFLRQRKDLLAIPETEIDIIKRVAGDVEETYCGDDFSYDFGEVVEVASGHLAGMKGKIITKLGKKWFVVELDTIGFHLRINIDLDNLRPVDKNMLIA